MSAAGQRRLRARVTFLAACTAVLAGLTVDVPPARAHLGDLSYCEIVVHEDALALRLRFAAHLIPGGLAAGRLVRAEVVAREPEILEWLRRSARVSVPSGPCLPSIVELIGPDRNDDLTVVLGYACPSKADSLRIEFHPFDEVMPQYRSIVSVRTKDVSLGFVFTRETPVLVLGEAAETNARSRFTEFFKLGIEHIWTGYDHLLFLLALFLPGGSLARIAGIVTAFTVAHSLTLSLAALDIVRLPVEPVEIAIAASIVVAAVLALRASGGVDRRWQLTLGFGLVHGFGFASVLRAAGLPPQGALVPLLSFNLGVEAGQLVVVVIVVPVLRRLMRADREIVVRRVLAIVVLAAGAFWLGERTASWLNF